MDLRLTFNSDPMSYDKLRPTYSGEMFQDLISYSECKLGTAALEIGIGTGQATRPMLDTGCHITAVELGNQLAEFSRKKYSDYANLDIITGDFEHVQLDKTFNLIYSASAFHWIPEQTGLSKVMNLLEDNGVFAWLSIQPSPSKDHQHIHNAIQEVYGQYSDHFGGNVCRDQNYIENLICKTLDTRVKVFDKYNFCDIKRKTYHSSRTFTADEYCQLISTYSDHKSMPEARRESFLNKIRTTIESHGGYFSLDDTVMMVMGKKINKSDK